MLLPQFLVIVAFAVVSNGVPATFKHALHEKRDRPASNWIKTAKLEGSAILPMRIGLTQTNLEKGYDYLMEVSDPHSQRYGQHWSKEAVHDAFAPEEETIEAVREWLKNFGIRDSRVVHTDNKGWLAFDASVEEAEQLLLTEFYEHEHKYSEEIRVGCDQYHVPEHLQLHIDYITPGIKLSPVVKRTIQSKRSTPLLSKRGHHQSHRHDSNSEHETMPLAAAKLPKNLQTCTFNMTPTCIRALYSIQAPSKVSPGNSLGIFQQGLYFTKAGLNRFYASFAPWVPKGTYPVAALIDGGKYDIPAADDLDDFDANLDYEMSYSLIYPQNVTVYSVDDQIYAVEEISTRDTYNTFLDALDGSYCTYSAYGETGNDPSIDPVYPNPASGGYHRKLQCGVYKPTNVIIINYGQAEIDLPINYTKRQCNEFMKLALQGHSILSSTGNNGVASYAGDGGENGCLGPEEKIFNPGYPNNCPYVTSVGGTILYPDQTIQDRESVMNWNISAGAGNTTSSGGFSNYFPSPSYQAAAVDRYFDKANLKYKYYSQFEPDFNTVKGLYNRIGRAYPDVSAMAGGFPSYITSGKLLHWYGTSLASVLFGSVLTLLNEERIAVGKGPVGFVNPVLYSHPHVLNDITNGTTYGCNTAGFPAVEGWDPATGLGTPNYPKMKELFLSLP